jgi:hypothetical protein
MSRPLTHADLVADQLGASPWGSRTFRPDAPPVRIGASGRGDDLLVLGWSAAELAREVEAGARLFAGFGIGPATRVANTLPGALVTPGALLVGDVDEHLGALDVPLGVVESEAAAKGAWELFDRVQAEVLIVPEASEVPFFRFAPPAERPWWRGIVWMRHGRALGHAAPPAGFAGWQRIWVAVPEVTSFAAASCERDGLHPAAGVTVEELDGELVVGSTATAWPARYRTSVRGRIAPSCPCGAPGAVVLA